MKNQPKLQVLIDPTTQDKNTKSFLCALTKKGATMGVSVVPILPEDLVRYLDTKAPALVATPYGLTPPHLYNNVDTQTTASVIFNILQKNIQGENVNVLLLGCRGSVGKPLSAWVRDNLNVNCIAVNSHVSEEHLNQLVSIADYIVCTTSPNAVINIHPKTIKSTAMIIDAVGNMTSYSSDCKVYVSRKIIGDLSVESMLQSTLQYYRKQASRCCNQHAELATQNPFRTSLN